MERDVENGRARPDRERYYMGIALAVRERAACLGSRVGAVLVRRDRIISTGYNGVPEDMMNCDEGGCERCSQPERFASGSAYDVCICVHAEQNALLSAARFGNAVEGSEIYSTHRPCFGCMKELLQAGVRRVHYLHEWRHPDDELWHQYRLLESRFPEGVRQVAMEDPRAAWADSRKRAGRADTGHGASGG